ncbi:MAG: nucleotide exchange factor GrpE, partial [Thermodesulfovibrionales bacterium]|nr:nucleotide exchange factor GrpE [Thermodesulfovibrionales bacterium]
MRHKAKKKIEENMTEDNSHQEFHEPDSSAVGGQDEAVRCIAAETPESAASRDARENLEKNLEEELGQEKDRYLRLYAEFDNYKKRIARDKEELIKYGNESLLYEL